MINKKNLSKIYLSIVIVILLAFISAITFFLKNTNDKNYVAIIDLKLSRSIEHIFVKGNESDFITDYSARFFESTLPKYSWDKSDTNNIEVTVYAANKSSFYKNVLPEIQENVKKQIPVLNKIMLDKFQETYKNVEVQDIITLDKSDKTLFYWSMSQQPYYTGFVKTKVRFRKLQLTQFEFIAISIFLTMASITLISSYYIVKRKKFK